MFLDSMFLLFYSNVLSSEAVKRLNLIMTAIIADEVRREFCPFDRRFWIIV